MPRKTHSLSLQLMRYLVGFVTFLKNRKSWVPWIPLRDYCDFWDPKRNLGDHANPNATFASQGVVEGAEWVGALGVVLLSVLGLVVGLVLVPTV